MQTSLVIGDLGFAVGLSDLLLRQRFSLSTRYTELCGLLPLFIRYLLRIRDLRLRT